VHVSGLVDGVIAGPNSPGRISPLVTVIMGVIVVLLKVRSWRQGEVHKMGDGGLALAAIDGLHGGLQKSSAVDERSLSTGRREESYPTDSASTSSSAKRARRCALCCLRRG
jgi:hypothetical protein